MGDKKHDSSSKQLAAEKISETTPATNSLTPRAQSSSGPGSALKNTRTTPDDKIARPEAAHLPASTTKDASPHDLSIEHEPVHTGSLNHGEGAGFDHDVAELRDYSRKPDSATNDPFPVEPAALKASSSRLNRGESRWKAAVLRFWKRQVSLNVDHESCRDHLALERTFLGYVRTSLALSFTGVTVAQLFRLDDTAKSDSKDIYYLGRGMSSMFIAGSMVIITLGGWRFWRQQNALVRGKIHAGGFEIYMVMFLVFSIVVLMFAVVLGIDRFKPKTGS